MPPMQSPFDLMFPKPVAVAEVFPTGACFPLFQEEEEAVARAVLKRRIEFSAGRHCARLAMQQFGCGTCAVPAGPDRAPVWPDGLVGSISHCAGYCAAVLALDADFESLGIDVEPVGTVPASLAEMLLLPEERREMESGGPNASVSLTAFFCAKEAVYKNYYPRFRRFLGFHDVHIRFDARDGGFTAQVLATDGTRGSDILFTGKSVERQGRIYSACW